MLLNIILDFNNLESKNLLKKKLNLEKFSKYPFINLYKYRYILK